MNISTKPYWFKPARFWKWFAAYYPVTWQGWVVSVLAVVLLIKIFIFVDSRSHSVSDTLLGIAPWFIAIGLAFDMMCFRKGEYPAWWRHGWHFPDDKKS